MNYRYIVYRYGTPFFHLLQRLGGSDSRNMYTQIFAAERYLTRDEARHLRFFVSVGGRAVDAEPEDVELSAEQLHVVGAQGIGLLKAAIARENLRRAPGFFVWVKVVAAVAAMLISVDVTASMRAYLPLRDVHSWWFALWLLLMLLVQSAMTAWRHDKYLLRAGRGFGTAALRALGFAGGLTIAWLWIIEQRIPPGFWWELALAGAVSLIFQVLLARAPGKKGGLGHA